MARMHSRKKGKSGSKKPIKKVKQSWNVHTAEEVEQLVVKLGKTRKDPALIGLILRDTYGIPDVRVVTGKTVNSILEQHHIEGKLPEDLKHLIMKDITLLKHSGENKKDMTSKRGLHLTLSKINRLAKYYTRVGKLPADWKYDRSRAKSFLE